MGSISNARGQVVIEFLIITAIAMAVALLYLSVSANLLHDKSEEQRIAALNTIGYAIQDELILAGTVQDGYVRVFTLPEKAGRFTYAVNLTDPMTATLMSGTIIINYPLPEVTAASTLRKGDNVVRKDGTIEVNA